MRIVGATFRWPRAGKKTPGVISWWSPRKLHPVSYNRSRCDGADHACYPSSPPPGRRTDHRDPCVCAHRTASRRADTRRQRLCARLDSAVQRAGSRRLDDQVREAGPRRQPPEHVPGGGRAPAGALRRVAVVRRRVRSHLLQGPVLVLPACRGVSLRWRPGHRGTGLGGSQQRPDAAQSTPPARC